MPECDLPAVWGGEEWRSGLEAWLVPALAEAGITVIGPVVRERVRFWSVVATVETDTGRVWVKENAPSQAFEAALVEVVGRLLPDAVATPVAVDVERGWLATADLGLPMWHDEDVPPVDDWVAVVEGYGVVQHTLAGHAEAVLATGVPTFPEQPDAVVAWVEALVDASRSLPDADPRRLCDGDAAAVADGLPRIREAAERLAAAGIPRSLQHNDLHLGNAFRRPGGPIAYIDLGDALWTHPMTAARIPLWIMRHRLDLDPDGPDLRRAVDAYLAPWEDDRDPGMLRALLPDAERISCLHRAESWRRLQADVPAGRVDEPYLRSVPEWLVDAAAPDPYASAIRR